MAKHYFGGTPRATSLRARIVRHDGKLYRYSGFGDGSGSLAATLREYYAECFVRGEPCRLSVPELARKFVPHAKRGDRQIERAHTLLRISYPERFVEDRGDRYGPIALTVARWIVPKGRGGPPHTKIMLDQPPRDLRDLELRAKANARARTRAPRKRRPPAPPPPRRPARPHGVTNPAICAPVALEAGVLEAVRAAHGGVAWLVRELQRPRCHAHADEARLAARTLAARTTDTPLRLFRHLFSAAIGGDQLIDKRDQIARTVRAELEGMLGPPDVPVEERLEELEQRLAAVHVSGGDPERVVELERAIRALRPPPRPSSSAPRPTVTPPPERKLDPARTAAYVGSLPAHLRCMFEGGDTS